MKKNINVQLVSQAVSVALSNKRQGTSKVKTRSEVNLTKRKMYKQKGTGGARHGAKSAHIFVGGGVAHGPVGNANWNRSLPKTMKRMALKSALEMQSAAIVVVPELNKLSGKTKEAVAVLDKVAPKAQRICVVLEKATPESIRSLRNISRVTSVSAVQLNALHIVQADKILFTEKSKALVNTRITGKPIVVEKPVIAKTAKSKTAKPKKAVVNKQSAATTAKTKKA
ncbi:MAG: 50S ribosomal protein L4 [Candidatus Pacebacteria bacterium]|nr:50S ribosomal protein L4 [Candidatus Paceibacterota bacterium]PIR60531.1 MAG: 50S ribosomal protein L4 [Candidatus Pacebacteria bacterium CG10_big_fil_rev_8_21_14_0_10_44_54]